MAYVGFDKLKGQLKGKGIRNPGAPAKGKFQHAAAKGKSMRGMKAKKQAEALEKE